MPPAATVNRDFLRLVLKGDKNLLKMSDCKFVTVPHYDELGVKHVFPKFLGDIEVMKYMQDEYPKDRFPDRAYFFTVLNTVHPEYVGEMISHANRARFAAEGEANERQTVEINDEWWNNL